MLQINENLMYNFRILIAFIINCVIQSNKMDYFDHKFTNVRVIAESQF